MRTIFWFVGTLIAGFLNPMNSHLTSSNIEPRLTDSATDCPDYEAKRLWDVIDTLVPQESWLHDLLVLNGYKARFPELFYNFNIEIADSIIDFCEEWMYDTYGPRESIEGKCQLEPLKGKDKTLPKEFELCKIFNGGSYPMEIVGCSTRPCDNYLPYIDHYREMRSRITPRIYKFLELGSTLTIAKYPDTWEFDPDPFFAGDRQFQMFRIYCKKQDLIGACYLEMKTGRNDIIDSVLRNNNMLID